MLRAVLRSTRAPLAALLLLTPLLASSATPPQTQLTEAPVKRWPWSLTVSAGMLVHPWDHLPQRWQLGVALYRELSTPFEVGLVVRVVPDAAVLQFDASASIAAVLRWGWFAWRPGLNVGYSALRVADLWYDGPAVWSHGLLVHPRVLEVAAQLRDDIDLRLDLGFTAYFDRLWMWSWEPSVAFCYRF